MKDRTGQVWELHAHLGVPPRAALVLGRVEPTNELLGDVAWRVVMLTGDSAGRVLTWDEFEDDPFEQNPKMTRLA